MFYKLRLGVGFGGLYEENSGVTSLLRACLDSGILEVGPPQEYHRIVTFNNGVRYSFWNANKYYAWMSEGEFYDEVDKKTLLRYHSSRPSWKYVFRTKKAIQKFYKVTADSAIIDNSLERIYQTIKQHAHESN